MDLRKAQKDIYANKIKHGFNLDNIDREFCYIHGELSEAYEAYYKKHDNLAEELADVGIYLLGLAEILGIDLESEIEKKMKINENREYVEVNGVKVKKGSRDDL